MEKINSLIQEVKENTLIPHSFKIQFIHLLNEGKNTSLEMQKKIYEEARETWERQLEIEKNKKIQQKQSQEYQKNIKKMQLNLLNLENSVNQLLKNTATIYLHLQKKAPDGYLN